MLSDSMWRMAWRRGICGETWLAAGWLGEEISGVTAMAWLSMLWLTRIWRIRWRRGLGVLNGMQRSA